MLKDVTNIPILYTLDYNFVIEYWAEAINQIAIPQLTGKSGIDIQDKNSIEELRKRLLNRIFQNGKLDLIFKKAQVLLNIIN